MRRVTRQTVWGIGTCPRAHDHGLVKVELGYDVDSPLVFTLDATWPRSSQVGAVFHKIYREAVYFWLLDAPGGSTLKLGELSLEVRLAAPYSLLIQLPPAELDAVKNVKIVPLLRLERAKLQEFLTDTYAAVDAASECDYLDVDGCIEKILAGGAR